MSSERALWDNTRRVLSPFGRVGRIENRVEKGWPDVAYCLASYPTAKACTGFLELKHVHAFPKDVLRPVRVDSLTREQVAWAEDWAAAGGRIHMLLQIGSAYYLLPPSSFRPLFNRQMARGDLFLKAERRCAGKLITMKLGQWLSHNP